MAGKCTMMFIMEGAQNLISYMMMLWGMVRSVVFVVQGMGKSVRFVVWQMVRWVVLKFALAFQLVFVLRSVVGMVVVIVSVAIWRG